MVADEKPSDPSQAAWISMSGWDAPGHLARLAEQPAPGPHGVPVRAFEAGLQRVQPIVEGPGPAPKAPGGDAPGGGGGIAEEEGEEEGSLAIGYHVVASSMNLAQMFDLNKGKRKIKPLRARRIRSEREGFLLFPITIPSPISLKGQAF
jgi:hypothetical protein